LNDQVIEWKGIEATEKLADSPNAKVIIVGSGKNGLPVILNTAGAGAPPQNASAHSADGRPGADRP
jgi:regulator of protease activity HflC (stomatin/prohibitin superfamily)